MISLAKKFVHPTKGFEIDPRTLARHLGRVMRFGGAADTWYSVLQHSLFVSEIARSRTYLTRPGPGLQQLAEVVVAALLHDAHEFLTGDVPTDWKSPCSHEQEREIDTLIRDCLGAPAPILAVAELVKQADRIALVVEANHMSPFCLEANPTKFVDPDLVAEWAPAFQPYFCSNAMVAFQRNWQEDGMYVDMYTERLEAALRCLKPL